MPRNRPLGGGFFLGTCRPFYIDPISFLTKTNRLMNIQDELSIAQRLTTRTPTLFRGLRIAGILVTGIAGILMGLQEQGILLPSYLSIFANVATILTGLTTAGVSSLTVDVDAAKSKNAL